MTNMAGDNKNRYLIAGYSQRLPLLLGEKRRQAIKVAAERLTALCDESIRKGIEKNGIKGVNARNTEYGLKVRLFKVTVVARLCVPKPSYRRKTVRKDGV